MTLCTLVYIVRSFQHAQSTCQCLWGHYRHLCLPPSFVAPHAGQQGTACDGDGLSLHQSNTRNEEDELEILQLLEVGFIRALAARSRCLHYYHDQRHVLCAHLHTSIAIRTPLYRHIHFSHTRRAAATSSPLVQSDPDQSRHKLRGPQPRSIGHCVLEHGQ